MKEIITELLKGHAELRKSTQTMLSLLGKAHGIGWDDETEIDLQSVQEAQKRFSSLLSAHEREEDRSLSEALNRLTAETKLASEMLQSEHKAIREVFGLLQTVTCLCDGRHVHKLRSVMSTVADLLERHLAYEENELFPLIIDEPSHGGGSRSISPG